MNKAMRIVGMSIIVLIVSLLSLNMVSVLVPLFIRTPEASLVLPQRSREAFYYPRDVELPVEMPVWAVYERDGVLTAVTAIKLMDGRLLEYNVHGGPVLYYILEEPKAWMPYGWTD